MNMDTIRKKEFSKGLVLHAPAPVTVKLYTGLAKGETTLIDAAFTDAENGIVSYFYPDLDAGNYHFVSSGEGYFSLDKDIYFSEAKAAVKTVVNADPGKKGDQFYQAKDTVFAPTDEFMEKVIPSDPSLWPDYAEALTTPMFTDAPRAAQQYTTYAEMLAVLKELDRSCRNAYLYYLGKSNAYDIEIPLIIFTQTDLSGVKTLEQAAELVLSNGKLTVHYQGQMHGNEPAGGEGALGVCKLLAGSYGETLLDTMNIYVIPKLNCAGARDDRRTVIGTTIDPNRDMLRVETSEIRLHHKAYHLFCPALSIDSHEYTVDPSYEVTNYNDIMLASGFTSNNSEEFRKLSKELTALPFGKLKKQGLRPTYYIDEVNFHNPNNGSTYSGNQGILYLLIESRGIWGGHNAFARRAVGHVITVTELLNYVHENLEYVKETVAAEKDRFKTLGKTYSEEDLIVLEHGTVLHPEMDYAKPRYNGATGELVGELIRTPKIQEAIVRSRPRPTAYVFCAGEEWTQTVLEKLDLHYVKYHFIPAGKKVLLQQYRGTAEEAILSEEQYFAFPKGAYAVPMDTYYGTVLATMFEPDITDSPEYKGTLVQSGVIPPIENGYPLYRYIHDLNPDGTITAV